VLWGRADLLRDLPAYKVRPLGDELPWRWEQGTPQIELQAGLSAAITYLQWLGTQVSDATTPRAQLAAAWSAATEWEMRLAATLIEGLQALPGLTIHGITNPNRMAFRVPTVSFTHTTTPPAHIAQTLAKAGICVWSGNNYALEVVRHLGIEETTGVLRIGLAHYNTQAEVSKVLQAIRGALAQNK
jgi:selenocysteine lyase/cysteine desulfurase